jgi:hypothetical protein
MAYLLKVLGQKPEDIEVYVHESILAAHSAVSRLTTRSWRQRTASRKLAALSS